LGRRGLPADPHPAPRRPDRPSQPAARLPLLAFGVAELYGLEAAFAVGLVLLGASPGGTTANLLTHLARGDTALSVSMSALSSLAAVITVPIYLGLAVAHFDASVADDVRLSGVVVRVFAITIIPLAIGMAIAVGALVADELTIPAAIYSAVMYLTAGAFARIMYRRNGAPSPAAIPA